MHVCGGPAGWSKTVSLRRSAAVFAGALLIVVLFCGAAALQRVSAGASPSAPLDSDDIYRLTNVWTIHLKFAPDQWEAMEPKGGGNPFFGGPPGGRPGAGGAVNGDRTLAPAFMSQGDLNRDGRVSREEFAGLAESWFKAWDTNRTGRLDGDQIGRASITFATRPVGAYRRCFWLPKGSETALLSL
jgi:hypothetical protein